MMVNNFSDKANFIWSIANLLRDAFKRSKYQEVILPLTVLRRIDCVLESTKDQVLETYHKLKGKLVALAERDETGEICRDADGHPEPDPELRDTENVPLGEDIDAYFDREVRPHVPDAWINTTIRDHKDGEISRVGYEINFNRYYILYLPTTPAIRRN
jgi:hypothetical protein